MVSWKEAFSKVVSSCREVVDRWLSIVKPEKKKVAELKKAIEDLKSRFSSTYQSFVDREKSGERIRDYFPLANSIGNIIYNLEGIAHSLSVVVDEGIPFSDKAVSEVEELKKDLSRLLKDLEDLIKTENETLAKALEEEAKKVSSKADSFLLYHEERIITGVCLPKASPVYLNLLTSVKGISHEVFKAARTLGERGRDEG